MTKYITVDGGTSNTRIRLISDKSIIAEKKAEIGAGSKNNRLLSQIVHNGIEDIIKEYGCEKGDISAIIAGGMITSECGIYNVPHINAPVGIKELADGIKKVVLDNISEIPISFIPGVKKLTRNLSETDMMRGEECEFFGISKLLNIENGALVILPGSHTKIISSDDKGRIEGGIKFAEITFDQSGKVTDNETAEIIMTASEKFKTEYLSAQARL